AALAILDLLVLGERIGNECEERQVLPESLCKCMRSLFALHTILFREAVKRRLQRECVATYIKCKARHGFIEETVPCCMAGDTLLMKQRLHFIGKLIGAHGAQIAQPRGIMRKLGSLECPR